MGRIEVSLFRYLHDDISLTVLYSFADILVILSLQENLSNIIVEALSCALSVAAFDIGGNSDLMGHRKNGYLAKKLNAKDFARGIEWLLANNVEAGLSVNARNKVINEFSSRVVVQKYIQLYQKY